MNEASIVSLTAALRVNGITSYQRQNSPGDWRVVADSQNPYTTAQLTALENAHGVTAWVSTVEFGPGTEAQIITLEQSLRNNGIEYASVQKDGNWYTRAISGVYRSLVAVKNLEASSGLAALTTRAEFR